MATLIITRHPGLVEFLKAKGYVPLDAEVKTHASGEDVAGKKRIRPSPPSRHST